ncbi:MAG TPA: TetR/AcrR family transcriptional regulator [Anaerolineales bacterium]|nr:TetR/AcrR family transcriptional regulator [Anaerolineales bacterium]
MDTRTRILDTALQLFNSTGTSDISTNHIARACQISPGNLYYHFRNKQEIIRELFQRLYAEWDTRLTLSADRLPTLADVRAVVEANYQIIWEYRFAYRELTALLRQDAALHKEFIAVRQRGLAGFRSMFGNLVAAGVLREPDEPQAVEQVMEVVWLISEFWVNTLEISGRQVDEAAMGRGVELMLRVLKPYLA